MPPLPGEERLVTVYADIHYYFATPTARPVLHRFDKASYLYIYHNSTRQTTRIEVANNPGSAEQDAFSGSLDQCRIINSHTFPTLLTLVVDAVAPANSSSPSSRHGRDPDEWRLVSADPRDTGKTKYRLHTLDVYFWMQEDSKLAVETLKHLLRPEQLDVVELEPELEDEDPAQQSHDPNVSRVVQNLENVAISDPAYQNGQTRNSQSLPQNAAVNLPAPPPAPQQSTSAQSQHTNSAMSANSAASGAGTIQKAPDPPQNFAPLAYNPAAPPAPEPIAHREDTPPPPDDGHGIGLAAAVHDNPYSHVAQTQPQPWTGIPQPGHLGSPPPPQYGSPPASSLTPSFGPPPTSVSPNSQRHGSIAAQHYTPDSQMYQQQPVETPGTQFYSAINNGQPHKPLQHIQPQYADYLTAGAHGQAQQGPPPPGGYAQFNYGAHAQPSPLPQQPGAANSYDVHSQVYRPTESEAKHHHHRPSRTDTQGSGGKQSGGGGMGMGWGQKAERAEKGVGKFLKKIEKKIG